MKNTTKFFSIIALAAIIIFSLVSCDNGTTLNSKTAGAEVSPPTLANKTETSITINAVAAPSNGQTVEYARNSTNTASASGWQDGLTFSGLTAETTYYIFARSKENDTHNAGAASGSLEVTTYSTKSAVATPTANVSTGTYYETQSITLNCATEGASIYYTLDGTTTPTASSTKYTDGTPISITETNTLMAIAVKTDMNDSEVLTITYTIITLNKFTIGDKTYGLSKDRESGMSYDADDCSSQAQYINVSIELEDNCYISIGFFVPMDKDRVPAGTYNCTDDEDDAAPFTFLDNWSAVQVYDDVVVDDEGGYIYYQYFMTGGTITVAVTGTGDDAVYTITIDCTYYDDNNDGTFSVKGTYRGTFEWYDYSN